MIERFGMIHGWVIKTLTALATALLAPMMFLVTGDVIGRYFLNMPIPTVFEINSNFLMVLSVFFPLAYVHRRKEHIFVGLFTDKFPPRIKAVLEIVSILLGIFSFGSIGWFGLDSALEATRVKEYYTGVIDVPIWLSKWIIPIGCLAYCLELLFDGMRLILMIKNPLLYNQPLK